MFEEAGDNGEDGGIVGEGEPPLARDAGKQAVEFIESGGRQRTVRGADLARPFEFVVEHETKRAAAAGDREAVWHLGGNHKEVARAGAAAASLDRLHAFAREIENQLGERMAVRRDLGIAVAIELELAQDEAERVDFNFLDEKGTPGEHGVGFMLAKVGNVLTPTMIYR